MDNLKKALKKPGAILCFFPDRDYYASMSHVLRVLEHKKICFISLNMSAESLQKIFSKRKINTHNILFVDAISKGMGLSTDHPNTLFISSPAALTELSIVIHQILKKNIFEYIIFDSLSTLDLYDSKEDVAEKMIAHLIEQIKKAGVSGIFTSLSSNKEVELVKKSSLHMDKVITPKMRTVHKRKIKAIAGFTAAIGLVTFALAFLNYTNQKSKITGLFISNAQTSHQTSQVLSILILVFILSVIGLIALRNYLSPKAVSPKTLIGLKPKNIKIGILKKRFNKKIEQFLKKE